MNFRNSLQIGQRSLYSLLPLSYFHVPLRSDEPKKRETSFQINHECNHSKPEPFECMQRDTTFEVDFVSELSMNRQRISMSSEQIPIEIVKFIKVDKGILNMSTEQ